MPVFSGTKPVAGDDRAKKVMQANRLGKMPLSKFEVRALNLPTEAVYIYNISPIWKWKRYFSGLGNMILDARRPDQVYSDPLILNKRSVRSFDAGDRRMDHMVEEPIEIAEDFLRCSKEFPGRDENNLTTYGCFMTVGAPIEDLPAKERDEILDAADLKHRNRCREKVFEADGWAADKDTRRWITEMYRQCALFLGPEEVKGRQWVTMRGPEPDKVKTKECQYCGWDVKLAAVICPNCKKTIDKEGLAALERGDKGKA